MKAQRDLTALTDMVEDVTCPLTDELRSKAQRTICAGAARQEGTHAEQVELARELMMMLGVHPSQDIINDDNFTHRLKPVI